MKIRRLGKGARVTQRGTAALALLALAILADSARPEFAFADPAPAAATPGGDKATPEMQLRGVEDTMRASEDQRRRIEADIETIRADRARLNTALIDTTAKVQDTERQMDAANARLTTLTDSENALRRSLDSRRGVIADVLAVLQRMGRSPPPAILVRPQDMTQAIRAAMLLGSVIPDLKAETTALAQDLDDLANLRKAIAGEKENLSQRAVSLGQDRERLTALVAARQQSLADAEQALGSERDRAADLARQAANLKDLIARMESEIAPAKAAAAASRAADEAAAAAAADVKTRAAAAQTKDPARLKPAFPFADAKGQVALPAAGTILKTFGAPDAFGGAEKGVSMATPAAATVASPVDGWVAFSGPYRTYGQLLIINAGGGYYMVLAGMDRINVGVGQFVLAGEPVALMGDGSARTAAAAAIGAAQPILYIELRKDGAAIDPGPWWAKTDIEKARG
jgi:septal ring factor EnvC (AmiA/AmiB activator)